MAARIKKIFLFIFIVIFNIYISSCTTTNVHHGEEFKITYIYNDVIIEHNPSTYISGEITYLVDYEIDGFVGWYKDEEFTSNKVIYISNTTYGNLIFYAKVESDQNIEDYYNSLAPDDTKNLNNVLNDYKNKQQIKGSLPSTGSPQVLVIPVSFIDYPASPNIQKDLEATFFGTCGDTGWESVQTYYLKSSYGKLNIKGTVLPTYNTGKSSKYYNNISYPEDILIEEILSYYDGLIDYNDYDYDKDGYIDSLYLIYTCPYDLYDESSIYWAYSYGYEKDNNFTVDNIKPSMYVFASYHFIFDQISKNEIVKYNALTYIHETGHLLGLDDYYDYDEEIGPFGGVGGGDMMDQNIGDHCSFSKIILGWTTPYLVNSTTATIKIRPFEKSGDVIMIPKSFNGTYFSEYYLIDYYTPTGLNEINAGEYGLYNISGIRIYHIDARLKSSDVYYPWDIYKYNNANTMHKLIKPIEADNNNRIENYDFGYSENSDLFLKDSALLNQKWYDGASVYFDVLIKDITSDYAIIEITIK